MLNVLLIIVLILPAIVILFLIVRLVSYMRNKNQGKTFLLPHIEKAQVKFSPLTNDESEINLNLLVKNHLPFRITAHSMQFGVYIDDEELVGSTYKKTTSLKAFGLSRVELPVVLYRADYDALVARKDEKKIESVTYQLKMSFFTYLFFKEKIKLEFTQKSPLFHFPKLTTEYRNIDSISFSRTTIIILVSIQNDNIFPLRYPELSYMFSIDDQEWSEGKIPGITEIKAHETTEFQIPVELAYKEVAKTLFEILKRSDKMKYTLKVNFNIESDINLISNARIMMEHKGSVKSLVMKSKVE